MVIIEERIKNKSVFRVVLLGLVILFYKLLFLNLIDVQYYTQQLIFIISGCIADAVILLSNLFDQVVPIKNSEQLLQLHNFTRPVIIPQRALFPYLVALTAMYILIRKEFIYKTIITVATILFLYIRAAIITWINLHFKGEIHYVVLLLLDPMVYLPMVLIIYSLLNKVDIFQSLYQIFEKRFQDSFSVSSYLLLLMILVLPAFPRIILHYIDVNILRTIVDLHLIIASWIIETFTNYNTLLDGRYLFIGQNWISLNNPCLGTGVITIIILLISTFKSPVLNKVSYSFIFVISFILMNAIRLALLLIYIHRNIGNTVLNKELLHNSVTYVMYLFALIAFVFYVVKYSEIKFRKKTRI